MALPNVSPANVRGLLDKVIGLGEEIVGHLAGNERLTERGRLHQQAGSKRLDALEQGAKAQRQRAKAAAAQVGQRAAQRDKAEA